MAEPRLEGLRPVWDQRGPVDRYGRPVMPKPEWVGGRPENHAAGRLEGQSEPSPVGAGRATGPADPLPVPRLPITRETPWRAALDCGLDAWLAEHKRIGSVIPLAQQKRCYAAVKPWSAQALATGVKETELGNTAAGANNFLNLFVPAGDGPKDFATWEAGAKEWFQRLSDETYKGFVYGPRGSSIEQIVVTYQGGPGCWTSKGARCANGETWTPGKAGSIELSIQQFVARVNTFMGHVQKVPWEVTPVKPRPSPAGAPPIYTLSRDYARFGLTKQQAETLRAFCFANRSGQGVLRLLLHVQEGNTPGSLGWWLDGYVNGQKVQASATVMAQQDGSLLEVIDPDDGPWTNGDTCSPNAWGQRFLAECQGGNPNLFTESCEVEGFWNGAHSNEQLDAVAWWVQSRMAKRGLTRDDVGRHGWLNACSRANCCGDVIWNGVMARL
jgi:hypothetical protein